MRFLATALATMALVASVDALPFQFDVTGDNAFKVYYSQFGSGIATTVVSDVGVGSDPSSVLQTGWSTAARYSSLNLAPGDVLSVYVHNELAAIGGGSTGGNPSALIGRLRELTGLGATNSFKNLGQEIVTNNLDWLCAYRVELTDSTQTGFNPSRWTGSADDWARDNFNLNTNWPYLGPTDQSGSSRYTFATQIAQLGTGAIWDTTNVDGGTGTTQIRAILGVGAGGNVPGDPWWIYGTNQQTTDVLAHHGWCRYTVPGRGNNVPGGQGDPVFSGFQGQEFQFHGLPDEHFNLISSPQVQLNAHFVYLSAGKCDYNDTVCWTHPGTYMDVMGFSIGESHVKIVAGTHDDGLRVWFNDAEVQRHTTITSVSTNVTASLTFSHVGHVHIQTELINYEVINSDMFMNLRASLKSSELLMVGSRKHSITDKEICHANTETHNHQLIEQAVSKKYRITTPLHGLIGQTWRNVKACGRDWMGTVEDYVVDTLFGSKYHYSYFLY